jgi:hypothetical protein
VTDLRALVLPPTLTTWSDDVTDLLATLHLLALTAAEHVRRLLQTTAPRAVGPRAHCQVGASTLEVVVIALGLFLVAGLLVAAITAAVTSRLGQLQ